MNRETKPQPRLESALGLAFWREALVGFDWVSLRTSAVYYGFGVPRGDGSAVVVVPGFLGSDRYLMELYQWLGRMGYTPYYSRIGRNADCPDLLLRRLLDTVERAHRDTGKAVRLVGHSLGGTLALSAAVRRPQQIAQVITLGSPLRFARVHPAVLAVAGIVRGGIRRRNGHSNNGHASNGRPGKRPETCYTDSCTCGFVATVSKSPPPSVLRHSIFTRDDGVVDWHCCLDEDGGENIEVKGTHCGLAFNPQVYRLVARLLSGGARLPRSRRAPSRLPVSERGRASPAQPGAPRGLRAPGRTVRRRRPATSR